MFDFQKLHVYQKSLQFNTLLLSILKDKSIERSYREQLRRASFSISLNIAEGSSRFSKADRKHFYVISRGSTYECVAIIDHLTAFKEISSEKSFMYMKLLEEISKMLYVLIAKLGPAKVKY